MFGMYFGASDFAMRVFQPSCYTPLFSTSIVALSIAQNTLHVGPSVLRLTSCCYDFRVFVSHSRVVRSLGINDHYR